MSLTHLQAIMTCEEFERELDDLLARGESVDFPHVEGAAFAVHVEKCASCREAWEGAKLLAEALRSYRGRSPSVPSDFADRVLSAWQVEQTAPRPVPAASTVPVVSPSRQSPPLDPPSKWTRPAWVLTLTLAVAIVGLSIVLDQLSQPLPNVVQAPPVPTDVPDAITSTTPGEAPPPVEELVRTARSAYLALAQDAAHAFRDAATVVVPEKAAIPSLNSLPTPPALPELTPALPDRLDETLGQWLDRRG